ncbi:MAG: hypothetical protein ABIH36_04535 [bacterium]
MKIVKLKIKNWLFLSTAALIISLAVFYIINNRLPDNDSSFLASANMADAQKPPDLIEQNLDEEDENFSVLSTKLNSRQATYQMAFTLQNTSDQEKTFQLVSVSDARQTRFQAIRGVITTEPGKERDWQSDSNQSDLDYNTDEHKQQLIPELAQAYDDIEQNGYTANPQPITLAPNATLLAVSAWAVPESSINQEELKPIYLLVHGSAGGAKDDLNILNIYSHPRTGDDWDVYFTTQGQDDLTVTPADQNTINHMDFTYLGCSPSATNLEEALSATDYQEMPPQILANDVIYYPNWSCSGVGKLVHRVNVGGKHTLEFNFNGEIDYAYNSNLYWVGGAGGNTSLNTNWSTTDPAACNPGGGDASAAPTTTDVAIFDPDCDNSATIDANWSVAGININSGYTGTITQAAGITLTVGTSNFIQADGTFTGGDSTITFNDAFTQSLGTFTASSGTTNFAGALTISGGTFNHNNGTISVISNGDSTWDVNTPLTVNNFTMNRSGTYRLSIATGDTIVVNGTTTLTDGVFGYTGGNGTLNAKGDISVAATFDGYGSGTSVLLIGGTTDQTFTGSATTTVGALPKIEISKTSGTLYLAGTIRTLTNWTYTQGTLDAATNDSTVVFAGGYTTITGSHTLDNVNLYKSNNYVVTIADNNTLTVAGTLTLTDGIINQTTIPAAGSISAQGNVTVASTFDGGTGSLVFAGSATQTFDLTGAAALFNGDITVNKSGGQVNLASALTMDATNQDLTIEEGTFDIAGNNLTVSGTGSTFVVESGGNLQLQGGESVTTPTTISSGSIVTYVGAASAVTVNDWSYKTLTFNAPGKQFNWTAGTTYTVSENFNVYGRSNNNTLLRSTSGGTTWGINDTGASEKVCYADVKDSVATVGLTSIGGVSSGNNTNWTFNTGGCFATVTKGGIRTKGGIWAK